MSSSTFQSRGGSERPVFSLLTLIGATAWIAAAVFIFWNMEGPFALLYLLVASYAVWRLTCSFSNRYSRRARTWCIAAALAVILLSALPLFLSDGLRALVLQPMNRRRAAAVANTLRDQLEHDNRFRHVEVSTGEFKIHHSVGLQGVVDSQRELDILNDLADRYRAQVDIYCDVKATMDNKSAQ